MALSGGTELTLLGVGQPSYSWRHTGGGGTAIVNLTGAETATPSFTAPNLLANDDLTFTLTVTVGNNTRTDTVVVTVEADNDDPTANAGPDQTVYEASAVTLSGSGSDPRGRVAELLVEPDGRHPDGGADGRDVANATLHGTVDDGGLDADVHADGDGGRGQPHGHGGSDGRTPCADGERRTGTKWWTRATRCVWTGALRRRRSAPPR